MWQQTIRLASELGNGYISLVSVKDSLTIVSKSDFASDLCVVRVQARRAVVFISNFQK
jgi:hypothetical protein